MVKEEINLEKRLSIEVSKLKENVPSDHARYHLFRLSHYYEGDQFNSIGNFFSKIFLI